MHSGHAPYNTEVRSCCGTVPDRSIRKSEDYSCEDGVRPGQTDSRAVGGWSLASDDACEEGIRPGRTDSRAVGGWSLASDAEEQLSAAPAFPCKDGAQVIWIADTGSANHLCSYDTLPGDVFDGMRPCPDVRLATANGIIEPEGQLEVYLTDLGVDARFLVLKDCPPVLSIGRLVEEHGFQFHWRAGRAWFVSPSGARHACKIKNYVPHFLASPSSLTTSAVASASPGSSLKLAVPGLAIANEAHQVDEDGDAGRGGQPSDAAEDAQPEGVGEAWSATREAKLRLEAKSPAHLLTHLPMNSYCDICQAGKLRQKPARRRRNDAELQGRPDEWGHTLLADHVSTGDLGLSIDDDKYGLVMLDVATDVCDVLASSTKHATAVLSAVKEFGGAVKWTYFFTDGAKELKKAAADLGSTVHLSSTPYRPESNGIIERRVGVISDGVRCLLGQSGLPHGWWTYAARAFCHGLNIRKNVNGMSPWHRRCGQPWPDKDNFAFGQQVHFRKPLPYKQAEKFAPRGSQGVFVGWFLLPGGVYKGDMLIVDLDELANSPPGAAPRVYRVKEVRVPEIGTVFPLRVAHLEARQRMLADTVDFIDDPTAPEEIIEEQEDDMNDDDDDNAEAPDDGSQALVRIPRGRRVYTPRVGPRPVPPLNDSLEIQFDQANPKRAPSASHDLYELYKHARTVGEARRLGATTGHVRYDLKKGFARLVAAPAVVVYGATPAPLVEAWCDKESPLGTVGDVMGRKVFRFTAEDDLSSPATIQRALQTTRSNPGSHLHGSLPCTPWTSWQRLNLHRGGPATKARVARIREQSLEWVKTFTRLGKATLAGGGSVSFEWPRYCDGWRQEVVRSMISQLKLIPVSIDGCAAGVADEDGTPIFKPWRIMVSDVHLAASIGGFKCSGDHLHRRCAGGKLVAQTAYYPRRLCEAIHKGLDAHEAARALCSPCFSAGPAVGASTSPSLRVSESSPEVARVSESPSGAAGLRRERREAVHSGHATGRVDRDVPVLDNNTEVRSCCGTVPDRSILTSPATDAQSVSAATAARRPHEDEDMMEALLRRDTAATADIQPVSWSQAGYLAEQVYAVADETDKGSHRQKDDPALFGIWNALVTRIITTGSEEFRSAGCQAALHKELTTLRERRVWDESTVCEWSDAARLEGKACVGRVFAIMGEKNAEVPKAPNLRTYKARCVFAGNNVQTSSGQPAWELYQEVSQTPAAMQTVRAALAVAGLKGFTPKVRDATQAYLQSRIDTPDRPATWVRLPKAWWPPSWHGRFKDPVCRLRLALYGHPESGALWDKHLSKILKSLGWVRQEGHPGLWLHTATGAILTVYVDDLMMAARLRDEDGLWGALEKVVEFGEQPTPIEKFLGGIHHFATHDGLASLTVNMKAFLISAVQRYMDEIKVKSLPHVRSPYLTEDFIPKGKEEGGAQSATCSSHLMKVLFAARLCRPDLLVAITRLASKVSCWQACHDRALRRLFSYILHHADMELFGTIKTSDLQTCEIWMWPDADLNGDMETSKSTSGLWVELVSADGLRTWPIAWRSKRQGSTASSTPEAETISMATGLKNEGLPMQDLFSAALGRTVHLRCLEDNTTAITAARAGYSPALRHLPRTERISVGVLYEILVERGDCTLQYQASAEHKGDMFTKRLDPATFEAAIARVNLRRMAQLAA